MTDGGRETTKPCVDCRHHIKGKIYAWGYPHGKSLCKALPEPNLVPGEMNYQWCLIARKKYGECGPDGRLWEPKEAGE